MINKVQDSPHIKQSTIIHSSNNVSNISCTNPDSRYNISFGASAGGSNFSKRFKLTCSRLFRYMSESNEITNAIIAAIGTGIIAPAIILVSPGKGDEEDKDKKFFQAIRQPLSAILALGFQLPATMAVTKWINNLAYDKKVKFFEDKDLGSLIPDESYLKQHVTQDELAKLEKEFDAVGAHGEKSALREELEQLIIEGHKNVGLDTSEDELAQRVKADKKNFLKNKIVKEKRRKIFDAKVQELLPKKLDIKDIDLVSEGDQQLAIQRNKDAYEQIKKEAKLSKFDKILDALGLSNKKLAGLKDKQKAFAKEKGLEILKEDNKELFTNNETRLRKYIETLEDKSKSLFKHRKFLISLVVNLFMVTLSCYALNWAHPRFKDYIDKKRHKKDDKQQDTQVSVGKKVEVRA